MKKTFAIAACAALSFAVAACGDDDDDASGDSTELTTPEVADTAASVSAADDTAADDTAADDPAADDAEAGDTGASTADTTAIEISDEQAADCTAIEELDDSLPDADPPAVGEEITDEYKDDARTAIEMLEGLDLQSDEGQAAVDSLVDDINQLVDADTMTEELQSLGASEEILAFGEICAANAAG